MKYANHYSYSDIAPYEVIRVVSEKCLEVRAMNYEKDPDWKPEFDIGGFCAHVSNQHNQKWIITSDESRPVVRIRLNKRGEWKAASGERFKLSDKPIRFYDYNF